VDVFYVKDVFGLRVEHEGKITQIKRALLDAIDPPKDAKDAKPGKKKANQISLQGSSEV